MNYYGRPQNFLDYYTGLLENAREEILHESEEQILGTSTEELAGYVYKKYALIPIEIDPNRESNYELQEFLQDIPERERDSMYRGEGVLKNCQCERAVVEVPIISNEHTGTISKLRSSTYSPSYSDDDFRWGGESIAFVFNTKGYKFNFDTEKIGKEVERSLSRINDIISWKNADITSQNARLYQEIRRIIDDRKQKISQNKEKISVLTKIVKIPLKKKEGASVRPIQLEYKALVQRVKPKPNLPEEYALDEDRVNDVVTLLDNQARSFEQTPQVFSTLGEENLRDIILSNLNSIFDGGATGETFSKNGKTDVFLKIAKGNIFICECKIWGGKKLYGETIDQLRGYLTWRHNYGVMVTFVRNKEMTKILIESQTAIQEHPSYKGGFKAPNETHFVSNHIIDDDDKEVKIHHLFYHLFPKQK